MLLELRRNGHEGNLECVLFIRQRKKWWLTFCRDKIYLYLMKSTIFFGIFTAIGSVLYAQTGKNGFENSSRDVTTQFKPKLITASKLLLEPMVPRSENPKIGVKFETPELLWNTRKITRPIVPEKLKDKSSDSVYLSNYARFGGGNYGHMLGELFLSNPSNSNYSYSFSGMHLSASPANSKRAFSDNRFQLQGAKYFENAGIETKIFYNRNKINYFAKDSLYKTPEANSMFQSGKISENYGMGIDYNYIGKNRLPSLQTGIGAQGFRTDLNQHEMEFNGYFNSFTTLKKNTFGINLSGTYIQMRQPLVLQTTQYYTNSQLFFDAFPYIKFSHDPSQLNVKIGALVTLWNRNTDPGTVKKQFFINPYLEIEKNLTGLNLVVYGGIDGGLKKNSLRRLNSVMPFSYDSVSILNSYEQINGYVGIKGKINQNAEFSLDFGGNSSSDAALVVSASDSSFVGATKTAYTDSLGSLQFVYVDMNSIYFRTLIKYRIGEHLKISASAKLMNNTPQNMDYAWHIPNFTYNVNAQYYWGNHLELELGLDGIGKRFNQIYRQGVRVNKEIPGFIDLHARLDYRISGKGRIWIQGSNLLNTQYQQWFGYKNFGLCIIGGISLSLF